MLRIDTIQDGIVIDHIKAGGAMKLYSYLKLDDSECSVAIIKNAKSSKMGKKDIIKIDGSIQLDIDILGVLDNTITINIIKNGDKIEKRSLKLPNEVIDIIQCKNPRCITSTEHHLKNIFRLSNNKSGIYRCIYCEESFIK